MCVTALAAFTVTKSLQDLHQHEFRQLLTEETQVLGILLPYENCGHSPMVDCTDRLAQDTRAFFAQVFKMFTPVGDPTGIFLHFPLTSMV